MMEKFNFYIDFDDEDFLLSDIEKERVTVAVQTALSMAGFVDDSFISYTLVSKEDMQELNKNHKNKDYVTDVLSFPQYDEEGFIAIDDEAVFIGDIVVCPDKLKEQASEFGHSYMRELTYISVHSALHLLGYDHIEEDDKKEMRSMEKQVMSKLKEVHDDL